jgi:hypothetical protein
MLSFGDFLNRAKSGFQKGVGVVGSALRRIGDVGLKAGRFLGQNAPAISSVAMGLGELSGNDTVKQLAKGLTMGANFGATFLPPASQLAAQLGQMGVNYGDGKGVGLTNHLDSQYKRI